VVRRSPGLLSTQPRFLTATWVVQSPYGWRIVHSSLVIFAGINVDHVGVAHHHAIAVAVPGVKESGSDVLFQKRWRGIAHGGKETKARA